jgi:hypothetical protein
VVDGQAARRGDPWRLVAVAGLLLALAVLAWALLR